MFYDMTQAQLLRMKEDKQGEEDEDELDEMSMHSQNKSDPRLRKISTRSMTSLGTSVHSMQAEVDVSRPPGPLQSSDF